MPALNEEFFLIVEKSGPRGVTGEEVANALGLKVTSARSMLSRWVKKGYLEFVPYDKDKDGDRSVGYERPRIDDKALAGRPVGASGRYKIGDKCKWWGTLKFTGRESSDVNGGASESGE